MANHHEISYFMGANSPGGFHSLAGQVLDPGQTERILILKGGPGCGKSTFMRYVSDALCAQGQEAEYILCSGDPQSLDAILFPALSAALVDGTAPHVVEPRYPGAVERYVDLGAFYDFPALRKNRAAIMEATDRYKACYPRAYHCLAAAGAIREDARAVLMTETLEQRMGKRAEGILSREVKPRRAQTPGRVFQRFLGTVSCEGPVCLFDTVFAQCERVYELSDRYSLAQPLLSHLLTGVLRAGFDAVACPDPMAPNRLAHLLIPQLSLAFVTTTPELPLPGSAYRRLRLDAMADPELLRSLRPRLRFTQKVSSALLEEAVVSLREAKEAHDALEALYHPFVDFSRVTAAAQETARELLSQGT